MTAFPNRVPFETFSNVIVSSSIFALQLTFFLLYDLQNFLIENYPKISNYAKYFLCKSGY